MAILEELSSSDDVCSNGGGITSEDRCQQTLRCQNSIAGYTLHWETMEYGTMIGNPRNVHDHPKDVAEADDLLKQHVYVPLKEICRIEIVNIIVQQQLLALYRIAGNAESSLRFCYS